VMSNNTRQLLLSSRQIGSYILPSVGIRRSGTSKKTLINLLAHAAPANPRRQEIGRSKPQFRVTENKQ
jgi:hypothetical protein